MTTIITFLCGTFLTTVFYYLGGLDYALQALLIFIVLDYITGVLKSIYNRKINSQIGAKGIIKKVGYLIIISVTVIIDNIVGGTGIIRNTIIYMFIANESISILENWNEMGLSTPKPLLDLLERFKKNTDIINNNQDNK